MRQHYAFKFVSVIGFASLLSLTGCDVGNEVTEKSLGSDSAEINNASHSLQGDSISGNDAASERLVLMKFGATWCPPCRKIDRELAALDRMGLPLTIQKIDVDEQPQLAQRYRISSIPRLMLMRGGRKIGDETGFMTANQLSSWIEDKASVRAGSAPKSQVQENPFFH